MIGISVLTLLAFLSTTTSCRCPGSPGDLIALTRLNGVYHHYAINVGNGYVVHLTGAKDELPNQYFKSSFLMSGWEKAEVKKEKCADVVKPGSPVYIEYGPWKDENKIIERALSEVGTSGYHVLYNNCEHFARWCRYGIKSSKQADTLIFGLKVTFSPVAAVVIIVSFPFLAVVYVASKMSSSMGITLMIMIPIMIPLFRDFYQFLSSLSIWFESYTNFRKLVPSLRFMAALFSQYFHLFLFEFCEVLKITMDIDYSRCVYILAHKIFIEAFPLEDFLAKNTPSPLEFPGELGCLPFTRKFRECAVWNDPKFSIWAVCVLDESKMAEDLISDRFGVVRTCFEEVLDDD